MSQIPSDPHSARLSYEMLVLNQPHIDFGGLWHLNGMFFAVVPSLKRETKARSGDSLSSWFSHNKIMGAPIRLVTTPPEGAQKVPSRSAEERADLVGEAWTRRDVTTEFMLKLPRDFPPIDVDIPNSHDIRVIVNVAVALTEEQENALWTIHESINMGIPLEVVVQPTSSDEWERFPQDDIDLVPSRHWSRKSSAAFARMWEEDEDYWMSKRRQVMATDLRDPRVALPNSFDTSEVGCLIECWPHSVENIRSYIPLYERIVLVAPLKEDYELTLAAMNVSQDELLSLCEMGRVQIVFPQSPDRYSSALLDAMSERAPRSMVLSRRLGAAIVAETRRRMPFIYPAIDSEDRFKLLSALHRVSSQTDIEPWAVHVAKILSGIGEVWMRSETLIHKMGAMAPAVVGAGRLIGNAFQNFTGLDRGLELSFATSSVELAATLNANVVPEKSSTYDSSSAVEFAASIFSGIASTPVKSHFGEVELVSRDVLGLNNDASVVDIANAFSGTDIKRMRRLITGLAESNLDPDYRNQAVSEFNDRVRLYDDNIERQTRRDFVGVVGALATLSTVALDSVPTAFKVIPLGAWLMNAALTKLSTGDIPIGQGIVDAVRAANGFTSRDVVLVSRSKKSLKKK